MSDVAMTADVAAAQMGLVIFMVGIRERERDQIVLFVGWSVLWEEYYTDCIEIKKRRSELQYFFLFFLARRRRRREEGVAGFCSFTHYTLVYVPTF
jgi:hypothetical protein